MDSVLRLFRLELFAVTFFDQQMFQGSNSNT
jgi:hypothetical protein